MFRHSTVLGALRCGYGEQTPDAHRCTLVDLRDIARQWAKLDAALDVLCCAELGPWSRTNSS
jgi:hypothetical protein